MKIKAFILSCALLLTAGCNTTLPISNPPAKESGMIIVTDSAGQSTAVQSSPQTVLALSSSIAEIWLLAGGRLAGVTSDAIGERGIDLPDDVIILGTVKDPSLESILALQSDLVLLSQDIGSHMDISETLRQVGIPNYIAKIETIDEYLKTLEDFTQITGDAESFIQNGGRVKMEVKSLLSQLGEEERERNVTALFLRAYSTGVKAKAREHTVCTILEDIGVENIAARDGFPLEELSLEAILEADPDYIFVVPMGDEAAANASLEASLLSNPAFASLTAMQNGNFIMLPKDLYHYKPNNRWGEAYENIIRIVYPQVFAEN